MLIKTTFRQQSRVTIADRERDEVPFQWRSGIQAFVVLLLSWASWDRRREDDDDEAPPIEARPNSAAASVKGYLGKRINWHDDIFGRDGGTIFRDLVGVKVRDGKSFLILNPSILEPADIQVVVDGEPIDDADALDALIEAIEAQRQGGRPAVAPAEPAAASAPAPVARPERPAGPAAAPEGGWLLAILHDRQAQPDAQLAAWLERSLRARGHCVVGDRGEAFDTDWAREVDRRMRGSDAVIVLLSAASMRGEDLVEAVEVAHGERQDRHGKPYLLPVRLGYEGKLPRELAACFGRLPAFHRNDAGDDERLVAFGLAATLLDAGHYGRVLLVASEVASVGLNWENPESILFGDAAAALVLARTPPGLSSRVLPARLETHAEGPTSAGSGPAAPASSGRTTTPGGVRNSSSRWMGRSCTGWPAASCRRCSRRCSPAAACGSRTSTWSCPTRPAPPPWTGCAGGSRSRRAA